MEKILNHTLLETKNLSFGYGRKKVLQNINLKLHAGEILGVVGGSGSGKTTLLKLLAGLLTPIKGQIYHKDVLLPSPSEMLIPGYSGISLVHQDFDIMPYITVEENLRRVGQSISKNENTRKISELKTQLKLTSLKNQKGGETSGGQKQRIAIAKAMSGGEEVVLLDEPFSNLDFGLKRQMLQYLQSQWKSRGVILVTHEPTDLLPIADRIVVLDKGKLVQEGSPQELYTKPKNLNIANLFGEVNLLSPDDAALFGFKTEDKIFIRPDGFTESENGLLLQLKNCRFLGAHSLVEYTHSGLSTSIIVQKPSYETVPKMIRVNIRPEVQSIWC